MTPTRFVLLIAVVIVLAGATVWLAFQAAGAGLAPWAAALGPLLLIAAIVLRIRRRRQ